jgi:ABC-type Fe3+-hydroxamate transport system substrate-binding protein
MQYYSQISSMLFTDQLNNTIQLKLYPKRIVSLVPSQSELLWDLGLREELVGITKFCVHPKELYKTITRIGGTKTVNIEKIRELKPDLIIGNKEENEYSQIIELKKEFPVWMSDIYNLNDSLTMIKSVGALVNRLEEANKIEDNIQTSFLNLKTSKKSVLYLIWKNPYMAAGNATFIGDMLHKMGLKNVLTDTNGRYPNLNLEDIKSLNPELIFLSSEPYPFKEKHIQEFKQLLPSCKIILVDGELFSWYGSRLLKSVHYLNSLL